MPGIGIADLHETLAAPALAVSANNPTVDSLCELAAIQFKAGEHRGNRATFAELCERTYGLSIGEGTSGSLIPTSFITRRCAGANRVSADFFLCASYSGE
jgi:hypothetical protein